MVKVRDEITYPFPNFNGATVEVWEWISNFIPHFLIYMIHLPIIISIVLLVLEQFDDSTSTDELILAIMG